MALEDLALDVMTAVGAPHLDGGCNGGKMLEPLVGTWDGAAVILGNGPTAIDYHHMMMGHTPPVPALAAHYTLACNGAIKLCPRAGVWLVSEARAHQQPWFWRQQQFPGIILWDAAMFSPVDNPDPLTEERLAEHYDQAYFERVIFYLRHGMDAGVTGSGWDTREWRDGLFNFLPTEILPLDENGKAPNPPYATGEVVGGVAMCAAHLACIMGASEIHLWGCPFSWREGGAQHADGSCPWSVLSDPVNQPYRLPDGRMTTKFMADSAAALRWYLAEAGVPWTNHSGGLLDG